MTYEKFLEVKDAARHFANVTETGCRNAEKKQHKLLAEWVKTNCRDRKQNSRYIVHLRSENYGTRKWSDYDKVVTVTKFDPEDLRETEASFIVDGGWNKTIIRKESVIGWLSEGKK